jgi:hypothetical protein
MLAPSPKFSLARSPGVSPAKELAIGVLNMFGDQDTASGRNEGILLVELLAYVADVLSAYQDKVAGEAYLTADWNQEMRVLRLRLHRDLRPALCLVADDRNFYVVLVGRDADGACVSFGEGGAGKEPATGSDTIAARYQRGLGATRDLTLTGLYLEKPFMVVAIGASRAGARRFSCSRHH